jgi:cytidylate kinase
MPAKRISNPTPTDLLSRSMKLPQVIAIDGPSASGKGTLSRRLAAELGYFYVDSGAMYRTLAWHCLNKAIAIPAEPKLLNRDTEKPIISELRRWKTELREVEGSLWLHVAGYFPKTEIRTNAVEKVVPIIAQIGKVRDWMVAKQRECSTLGPLVMEGRDIGTEVFPLAPVKFFLDASPAARAARLAGRGNVADTKRDEYDEQRKQGALIPAIDAIRIDNTGQSVEETFAVLLSQVRARLKLN